MKAVLLFLNSSVGRKLVMGLTGLFLCSFLVVHLYINLFLLRADDGETFDVYAEFMATYPLVRPLEWVLFAGFLVHAGVGLLLWSSNSRARPRRYAVNRPADNASFSSRFAPVTGTVVLVFLVLHVYTFFVRSRFFDTGKTMYELVEEAFSSGWYVAFYVVALVFLASHLKHGFQSAFQTIGIRSVRHRRLVDAIAVLFWLIIPIGFAMIPLYFLWRH